ncbi:hypothetical protein OG858_47055 (plasmid) [Streptomyces europaeiscabiei]|uniref:hypothetical protein n=1 Tax=Streptomyces europaeiscabiei TaxID=146819 RepID=UPI002E81BC09|nr:hypothetical protein [Streptomyces europaeiscabiei]WUD38867.1 hypothetical protein OG858_47055 [Streptomyces europaeiscabiei]
MPNFLKRRWLAGMEKSLNGFLEPGERLQYDCPSLVGGRHDWLILGQGERITSAVSDRAVYLLFNNRRPSEATRLSFDEIQRVAQTTPKTIVIETWDDADYVLAPQSARFQKTTADLARELLTRVPNRVVAEHRINLLPDGRGMTVFQISPPRGEDGFRWSLFPDLTLTSSEAEPFRDEIRQRMEEIMKWVEGPKTF